MAQATKSASIPNSSPVTLITGGNRGLGFATARALHRAGHTVVIGARNEDSGRAAAEKLDVEHVQIDVTDRESVMRAALQVKNRHARLDVLINNAGILGPDKPLAEVDAHDVSSIFDVNVTGAVRTVHAFLPLLRAAENPRIVNVSSGLGSFARSHSDTAIEASVPPNTYAATKAALNMLTVHWARALPDMRVNAADPGYTATDMGGGHGQPVEDGIRAIVTLATVTADGPTGTFIDDGGVVDW